MWGVDVSEHTLGVVIVFLCSTQPGNIPENTIWGVLVVTSRDLGPSGATSKLYLKGMGMSRIWKKSKEISACRQSPEATQTKTQICPQAYKRILSGGLIKGSWKALWTFMGPDQNGYRLWLNTVLPQLWPGPLSATLPNTPPASLR